MTPKFFINYLINYPAVEVKSIIPISQTHVIVKWQYREVIDLVHKNTNVVIAAYTTSMARIKLYSYLRRLGKEAYYYDTDSVIYLKKPNGIEIETGNYLGEMTDELEKFGRGSYIKEFVTGGANYYGFEVINPLTGKLSYEMKVKGFRINQGNKEIINMDTLKRMIGVDGGEATEPVIVTQPHQILRLIDHTVVSIDRTKIFRPVVDKVRLLEDLTTLSYGYKPS